MLKNNSSSAIVSIDQTPVSTKEFLYIYNKNNLNETPAGPSDIDEYLELFINFKLKVREAEALGLHRDSAFIKELEGYRKQLAAPYLTETKILDSLVKVTYERLKTEVNASHILIQAANDASPKDTMAAYEEIMLLSDMVRKGKDFGEIAYENSEDPSAKLNKGNLGYFTAMQMVYPFEEAAYRLPVDSVSGPVRTNFGYHLIKVHDKRPSQGRIQVSHILVRTPPDISPSDSTLAANRAREIYLKATGKEDWNLLCRQFSEDVGTKMKGGQLPWFKTGDISNIPSFEQAAFALEQMGDISEPVLTAYGWHIIKLDGKVGLETLEQLEPQIRSNLSANSRANLNQKELIKRLKEENKFKENNQVVEQALEFANENLNKGTWQSQDHWEHLEKVLFTIEKSTYKVSDFYRYVESKQPLKPQEKPYDMLRTAYEQYAADCLINFEEAHLADKHYDYKMLLKEYRDGILLFQLMESKVWNQAIQDTTGLKRFFENNQQRYQWDTRVVANTYNVENEAALDRVKNFIQQEYFVYNKYDFFGTGGSLNKAQVKILNEAAQLLTQSIHRHLVLQYDTTSHEANQLKAIIQEQLTRHQIAEAQITTEPLESGAQEFILFVASKSIDDLVDQMNKNNPLTIQVESGVFQKGENQFIDQVDWETGTHRLEVDERIVLVEIKEILPEGDQKLNEIRGQVISDYQIELESDWVKELRSKYPVEIYEKELEKIYEQYHQ
ncbi:MAG: peptidyl-prolyl cis-trans isomerase [Cyclobacteriaceae bacterium]|nr:MAG: peptidyl-prolyl cis-trans isomerase [Cyclobacteriaceae bacterium]